MIKPMLLSKFSKGVFESHNKWYVSEKYDGWRLIYKSGAFYTRQGNEIHLDAKMYRDLVDLPDDIVLDGELWAGYTKVNEVASLNSELKFLIFDLISDQPFVERQKQLKKLIVPTKRIKLVEHFLVTSDNYSFVEDLLSEVCSRDGEGLVLRPSNQIYQINDRPKDFMKLKKMESTEVEVTGYHTTPKKIETEGPDYISSLVCDYQGNTFKLNWRSNKAPPIGSIITIKFSQFTVGGLPKFPVYVGPRDSRDLVVSKQPVERKSRKYVPKPKKPVVEMTSKDWEALEFQLQPGETVGVIGAKDTWRVTRAKNGSVYCDCPAWLYQRMPPSQRTCKHCKIFT